MISTDAAAYFAFRLAGLEESPLAFGRSAEEYRQEPLERVAAGLEAQPGERVTFGAFLGGELLGGELVGAMTVVREPALKQRHKAVLVAVYVAPAARGQRVGETLLSAVLTWAKAAPGLLQLHLAVTLTQTVARRLYASQGFVVYGAEPRAMIVGAQNLDEELMVRFLD